MEDREVSKDFILAMEEKLEQGRKKDRVGWDQHWNDCFFPVSDVKSGNGLFMRSLLCEVLELAQAIEQGNVKQIRLEAADIANYAMFIADIHNSLEDE